MTLNAHPELPEFEYVRPASLTEASRFLAEHTGEARPLLGGTDIFVRMRDGFYHDKYLVDVKNLEGAQELRFEPGGNGDDQAGLTIGAGVNMNRVLAFPSVKQHYAVLAEACRSVASYQLRTRATIVGNICNASPAGDTIGASLALQGVLKVHGVNGYREEPLAGFFLGPGKTVLQPGDIVTQIFFPAPPQGSQGTYIKLGRNTWSDLSIVGVTAFGYPASNDSPANPSSYQFRLALASVAPVPLVPVAVQEYLASNPLGPQAFKEAAQLAADSCSPIDDVRGSARYRKAMVKNLTHKALEITWERLTR
jgi:CO/xanthine dehydrogenase FAD-binding subunit